MDFSVNVGELEFKNPLVASSGQIVLNSKMMRRCIEAGVGGVTTKSISTEKETYATPRPSAIFLDKYGEVGSMHAMFQNRSPEDGARDIREVKPIADKEEVIVIGNITTRAGRLDDWVNMARIVEDAGADMIELMMTCSIITKLYPDAGKMVSRDEKLLKSVVCAVKEAVNIPIMVKIGWEHEYLLEKSARVIEETGADAIHVEGYVPGTLIDVETAKPVIHGVGTVGKYMRAPGVYSTHIATDLVSIPVASSGGIWTWRDLVERIMAGATLVEVHTAAAYHGYKVFGQMINGFERFMKRKGYEDNKAIRGIAKPYIWDINSYLKFLKSRKIDFEKGVLETPKESLRMVVDRTKCTGCGVCATCNWEAITVESKIAKIDLALCDRCGMCWSKCPTNAIKVEELQ